LAEDDNKKRNEIVSKLEEISAVEQINEYGIMNNSILTATIIEARGLKRSSAGYKLFLTTEGQRSYTEVSIS
jgi:TfoX/Sxy family transcriptional regulator of competence genes